MSFCRAELSTRLHRGKRVAARGRLQPFRSPTSASQPLSLQMALETHLPSANVNLTMSLLFSTPNMVTFNLHTSLSTTSSFQRCQYWQTQYALQTAISAVHTGDLYGCLGFKLTTSCLSIKHRYAQSHLTTRTIQYL